MLLPIFAKKWEIIRSVLENPIVFIQGETGSGKTTQVPQYLYEALGSEKKICITQPRRVAAISLAERVSSEMGQQKLGELVGYRVRFDEKMDKEKTKIVFMTDGMLLREALLDKLLSSYHLLILDEVHERSVNSDVLLALVKEIAQQRKGDLKLVVMSATLDSTKFA